MNTETTKKCSHCGCKKLLKFFKIRESTGQYYKTCMKCCEKGSGNKKCSCGKRPIYGFENDKIPTCCSGCKKDGMIDIMHKKCSCGKIPYFGFEGNKTATCCSNCKKDGMIDIRNKKCVCGKRPHFGFENDKRPTCCSSCKKDGMIILRIKKCKCGKIPCFGFEGDEKATCCSSCKKDGMINIRDKRCKSDHCDIHVKRKYRGYCSRCFFFTFPDEKLTRNYKTKENTIVDHIKQNFPEYDWIHDRRVLDGCSLKRPDLYCDFGNHILVVEVDENSHKGYNCEEKRMFTIINDLGMRPTIFIRINPDKYTDEKTDKVIQSPFVMKKDTGKLEVKNQKELNRRLDSLCNTIKKYSEEKEYKIFNLEELFFC